MRQTDDGRHVQMSGRRLPAQRRRFRPTVDAVESRLLLSALTVTSTADSGQGSLRAAVAAAAPGDVIRFGSGLKGKTISLTSGPIAIGQSVTILGPGAGKVTIDGGGRSGLFTVRGQSTHAVIAGLTLTHGSATQGGAIDSSVASLTVALDQFRANHAGSGGAIHQAGGSLLVASSTFTSNRSIGESAVGGAIFGEARTIVRVSNSRFAWNRASGATRATSDATLLDSGAGGAIFLDSDSTLDVTSSTFANDVASGSFQGARGGAIATSSVPLTTSPATVGAIGHVSIANSQFSHDAATGLLGTNLTGSQVGGAGSGGAVSVRVPLTITSTRFDGNRAVAAVPSSGSADPAVGGAVDVSGSVITTTNVKITKATFQNNRAVASAGVSGGDFTEGGALYLNEATTVISGSLFRNNRAIGGAASGAGAFAGGASGGAIANWLGSLALTTSRFLENAAVGGSATGGGTGNSASGGAIVSFGPTIVPWKMYPIASRRASSSSSAASRGRTPA